jgi:hypothetical protein
MQAKKRHEQDSLKASPDSFVLLEYLVRVGFASLTRGIGYVIGEANSDD